MRKRIYLLKQHQKFLCICCLWLYNNAYHIVASFSFPVLQTVMKIVFCNGERPECSFTFPLPGTEIMVQPLPGIAAYSLTDTWKPGSISWRHIILGMKSRHVRKLYSAFLLITKVYFAFSSGHFCSAYQLSYFYVSFECVYTLLDFEKSVIVSSALGIIYSFTYRGVSKTNNM